MGEKDSSRRIATNKLRKGEVTLKQGFGFEAAHYLEQALAIYPQGRLHGHSFRVDIEISGPVDKEKGWVADLGLLKQELERIQGLLDHRLLNDIEGLKTPTLEHIAQWIASQLQIRGLRAVSVARPSLNESVRFVITDEA